LRRSGWVWALATECFKTMVNGNLRKTAALPRRNKMRARAGLQGIRGLRCVS